MTAPTPGLLHDIFTATARRHPEKIALEVPPGVGRTERQRLSYAALETRAALIRHRLPPALAADDVLVVLLPRDAPDLYAAQLAILSAGAAFACLDPRFDTGPLVGILEEAAPRVVLTDATGHQRLLAAGLDPARLLSVADLPDLTPADTSAARPEVVSRPPVGDRPATASPPTAEGRPDPRSLAYVIYTSGTTGRPKGVMIEHRSIVNLVSVNQAEFGLTPADRVAQCSSPAYDSSVEETWLAFAAGATLVVLDDDTVRLGPDLVPWLRQEDITVFCPPPTLLRATGCTDPAADLPELRLLYVGGEALTQDLAELWAPGRRMVNGYGPTECTVTVTRGVVLPARPVTIGRPVSGNSAWVLDEDLRPVAVGQGGELCLGGPGLARGYRGRPELSAERFPQHPQLGRIYRSGDLARWTAAGELEYLGRGDGQVKLRGYRIELAAIEAHLAAQPGVRAAGCRIQGSGTAAVLAAHVVPEDPAAPPEPAILRAGLRAVLPDYMVPGRFGLLPALPTGLSGKLDRSALPELPAPATPLAALPPVPPRNAHEAAVAAAFAEALELADPPPLDADFFLDLGGESLRAVAVIVGLRAAGYELATVRDLYELRTVATLAARLADSAPVGLSSRRPSRPTEAASTPPPKARPVLPDGARPRVCTLIQGGWLLAELWLGAALAFTLVYALLPWLVTRLGLVPGFLVLPLLSLAAVLGYIPVAVLITVTLKRLLIGRYRPLRAPVWGGFYTRHWIVTRAARGIPWGLLAGTVFCPLVLRALGARVGARVHVHRGVDLAQGGWDLLEIGDEATLAQDAALRLVTLSAGYLVIGSVSVGDGATVATRAGLDPGSGLGPDAYLAALSWLPSGASVPAGERWDGVPAAPAGPAPEAPPLAAGRTLRPIWHGSLQILATLGLRFLEWLPLTLLAAGLAWLAPETGERLLDWLYGPELGGPELLAVLLLPALALPVGLTLQALALRFLGPLAPGVVGRWSLAALRVWLRTGAVAGAGRWLSGALYWPPWLRLAGMRIGANAELSTIIDVLPETVTVGEESFYADGIYLCPPHYHRGTVTIASTRLGRRTFLGNHALVPAGHAYPEELFVGVSTVADPRPTPGSAWFGHPPLALPRREVVVMDRRLTYTPDRLRWLTRLFWETLRFALPILPWALGLVWLQSINLATPRVGPVALVGLVLPAITLVTLALPCAAVVGLKWLLLGRVRPGQHPFWSCWCGRWDFLYVAWGQWARGILAHLEGSLLLNAFLRLTGMHIGRHVVLGPGFAQVVDPDMLHFEDGATVTGQFQAHSFEDRVLKIDHVHIRAGASVGPQAVIFYGADVGPGARVAPHSVVMKGEVLGAGGLYEGHPVRPVAADRG